jgi:hypothetical protein
MLPLKPPAPLTFAQIIDVFGRQFPPALVSKAGREALTAAVGRLPDALSAGFIIECRLDADPQVDLGVVLDPTFDQGRAVLAGTHPSAALPEAARAHPVWRAMSEFCVGWADPADLLHERVGTIWLEFDVDPAARGKANAVPSFFFGPTEAAWQATMNQHANPARFDWLVAALKPFRALPDAVTGQLRTSMAAVPAGAEVFQIGLMLARESDYVRLCVRGAPSPALSAYPAQIGYPATAALGDLLAILGGLVENVGLSVDVGEGIGPRLGIECRFEGWRQPSQEPRWALFLDRLVAMGLCTAEKREVLLAWPSVGYHRFPDEKAPRALIRALNHVKVITAPGQAPTAKAYLWFGHRTADYIRSLRTSAKKP